MHQMLYIESRTPGLLHINGFFCGTLDKEGQAYPIGRQAEIYIQLFPLGKALPLSVALEIGGGQVTRLYPEDAAFALLWPDGQIQLELICREREEGAQQPGSEGASSMTLLRYLQARLAGDAQAESFLMRAQDGADISGYDAVVPLRFAPSGASERYDERAGLVKRLMPNVARVDAALAVTVPTGQGRRLIERIEIMRT